MPETNHQQEHRSFVSDSLASLTALCVKFPKITIALMIVSSAVCVWYTANFLHFKTNRADLIDPSAAFHQRWLKYTQSFGNQDDLVVVIESDSPEEIKHIQDAIGNRLKKLPKLFSNVLYRVEPGSLREKGLQYLSPDQLATGLERLKDYQRVLDGQWDRVQLEWIARNLADQLKKADAKSQDATAILNQIDRLTSSLTSFLEDKDAFTNPWPDIIPLDPQVADQKDEVVYVLNDEGTLGFVMAHPIVDDANSFEGATRAIEKVRAIIREVSGEHPSATISLTGIPVLENDEMRRSQEDMNWASVLSFAGVALLMFLGFRGFKLSMMGLIMLAVGMAWAFGFTTAVIGHLNILSVAFAAILIGLGDDFAVHVMSRYLELRQEGLTAADALVETSGSTGVGIITGAMTTSLAFYCATLTDFLGVAELGIIASGGILLCVFAAFTVLPAMIVLADPWMEPRKLPGSNEEQRLLSFTSRHPWMVIAGFSSLCLAVAAGSLDWSAGWPTPRQMYDHNLLHLQAKGIESVAAQTRIFEASKHSLLYAISLADSADEARTMKEKFIALPSVHRVEDLASRLPTYPASETRLLVQGYHALLAHLPEEPDPPKPASHLKVGTELENLFLLVQERNQTVSRDAEALRSGARLESRSAPEALRVASNLSNRIERNLDRFLDGYTNLTSFAAQMRFLGEFEYRMSYALLAQFQALEAASNPDPVTKDDLPSELQARFVSPDGKWMLQIFPKDQVWDMEPLERFVTEVRSVDPEVTGTPLQNFEAARQIKHSYEICAIYALCVISLVLLLDFLDKRHVPAAFLPLLALTFAVAAVLKARHVDGVFMPLLGIYTAGVFLMALILDRSAVRDTLLAITPPALGLGVTMGILGIFHVPLNPANLIILPLILGLGVDNGVHVMHNFHSKPNQVYVLSASTLNAIIHCSLTTMIGFGSMMVASHQGLYSMGVVLTIGVGSCMVVALVMLPAILTLLSRHLVALKPQLKIAEETKPVANVA